MVSMSQEDLKICAEARIFQPLKNSSGYQLLLDRLEAFADSQLAVFRRSRANDYDAGQRWRMAEEILQFIQDTVNNTLAARDELVAGVLKTRGMPDEEIDKVLVQDFGQ